MIYCLVCKEDVSADGYNPDYYGTPIHHNYQDSYCGPVVQCDSAPDKHEHARLLRNFRARERCAYLKRHRYLAAERASINA